MQKTVLLAGGSGLIGTRLAEILREKQYNVRLLTRAPRKAGEFEWQPAAGKIDDAALQGVDVVINLAGAGIADKRWSPDRKIEIVQSRVQAAKVLADAFVRLGHKPQAYISASAIGIYGDSGERLMTESDTAAEDSFMVSCCRQWEAAAETIEAQGIRTVILRIGVVMAREGGALKEIYKPLRFGLGAYFSDGQAWWSWIHRDDLCHMMIWAIETQTAAGVYNAVAPNPVRGKTLVQEAAKTMHQPAVFVPAPALALRLLFGEMSAVILNSNHITSAKIEQAGFRFQYPALPEAMTEIFRR